MDNCHWVIDSKLPVGILSDWQNPYRDCADWWVETKIGDIISNLFGSRVTHHSVGNFPDYDIIVDGTCFMEIKISTFLKKNMLFIETGKELITSRNIVQRKVPSGLTISKAQYYILLNPGYVKMADEYKEVMKMRFIKTEVLKELHSTTVEYSISVSGGKKTYGFDVDLYEPNFNDGCLGHFEYNSTDKIIDFGKFIRYNKEITKAAQEFNKNKN